MESSIVLRRLLEEHRRENLILFVGAGLSMAAGLPGWTDLIRPLAADLAQPPPVASGGIAFELLRIADDYEAANGRNGLVRSFRAALSVPLATPTTVHLALCQAFQTGTVITTNYDTLIENAFRHSSDCHTVVSDIDLAYWDSSQAQVIKIRGSLDQPDSMVITQRDYDTYPLKNPLLHQYFKTTLVTRTALFAGYSLSDPDMMLLLHQIRYQLGIHVRAAYSVQFDLRTSSHADWTRHHANVIPYVIQTNGKDRTALLESFFRQLSGV